MPSITPSLGVIMFSWLYNDPHDVNFQISLSEVWYFQFQSSRSVLWFDVKGAFDKKFVECVFKFVDCDIIRVISSSENRSTRALNRFLFKISSGLRLNVSECIEGYCMDLVLEQCADRYNPIDETVASEKRDFLKLEKKERTIPISDLDIECTFSYHDDIKSKYDHKIKRLRTSMADYHVFLKIYQGIWGDFDYIFDFNVQICSMLLSSRGLPYNNHVLRYYLARQIYYTFKNNIVLCDINAPGTLSLCKFQAVAEELPRHKLQSFLSQATRDGGIEKYAVDVMYNKKSKYFVCYMPPSPALLMLFMIDEYPKDVIMCIFNSLNE